MRDSFTRYVLWVLLPLGLAGVTGHYLSLTENRALARESATRLGRTGVALLAGEMGKQAAALTREATLLTNPDPASPLIRAAMKGDTVAALGTSSGELTLSLALAQGTGDSLQIRATTTPFPGQALDLFHTRTGRGIALYLRGRKARAAPVDFGGEALPGISPAGQEIQEGIPAGGVLLPLLEPDAGSSPARILVGPPGAAGAEPRLWPTLLAVFLAWAMGGFTWRLLSPRRTGGGRVLVLLSVTGVPLLVLWLLLGYLGSQVEGRADELLRGDMVRVLAILKDAGGLLSLEEVPGTSGFHVLRKGGEEVLASTHPPGPTLAALVKLPLPAPAFPTLGKMEADGSRLVYAVMREAPGQGLLLSAPDTEEGLAGFRLLMGGSGGVASLLALGFLVAASRPSGHREIP